MKLSTRFLILCIAILLVSLIIYVIWSNFAQQHQAEISMREKAYVLSQQLDAVWEFMAINQNRINHDKNGEYNFKGLHCSLVGKSIGKLFGVKTDYVTRYVNTNPRNKDDVADSFEEKALERFRSGYKGEIYSFVEENGVTSFRYVKPMYIDATCTECHGGPKGDPDILGYPKEGWEIGELAGVLSIIMPTDIYMESKKENMFKEFAFFSGLMLVFVFIMYYATAKLVTKPLSKLKLAMEKITTGSIAQSPDLSSIEAQGEIKDLTLHFSTMIKELKTVYKDLEHKVTLRTEDLAKANEILETQQVQLEVINSRLREDNKYKSDFLAIMSHELRTPLTSIIAFTEMLEKSPICKSNKEERILQEMRINNHTLLSLINNILDMARLEAGKAELLIEPVDFVDIVQAVSHVIEPLAEKKGLSFTSSVARDVPVIDGDREKLRRIVENLMSNAVKFTGKGGHVELNVLYSNEAGAIIINVRDNGIGIAENEQKNIFEKFVQGDNSIHRPYSGSGLGLALARELAELSGGTITLKSELGAGSLFTVTIPAKLSKEFSDEDNAR